MKKTYIAPQCETFRLRPAVLLDTSPGIYETDPDGPTGGGDALAGEADSPWENGDKLSDCPWDSMN